MTAELLGQETDWTTGWVSPSKNHIVALEIQDKLMSEIVRNHFLTAAAQSQVRSDGPSLVSAQVTQLGDGHMCQAVFNHIVSAKSLKDTMAEYLRKLPQEERELMNPVIRTWSSDVQKPAVA